MENKNERRDFFRKVTSVVGFGLFATSFGSVVTSCEQDQVFPAPDPETIDVDITQYPDLAVDGGLSKVVLTYKSGISVTVIVKRVSEGMFKVFSSICTHNNWEVDLPESPGGNFHCTLHDATFSSVDGTTLFKPFDSIVNLKNYSIFAYDAANKILKINA